MRGLSLLLITASAFCSGCGIPIADSFARSGFQLRSVTTKARAREEFGTPAKTDLADGQLVEHYRTRRKLAEPYRMMPMGCGSAVTYVTLDAIAIPNELYLLGRRSLVGQDFRIVYDSDETIREIVVEDNGDFLFSGGFSVQPALNTPAYESHPYDEIRSAAGRRVFLTQQAVGRECSAE